MALLLVIARVFHTFTATRMVAHALMGIMLGYYVPALLIKINVCRPIAAFWSPPSLSPTADGGGSGSGGNHSISNSTGGGNNGGGGTTTATAVAAAICLNESDLFVADTVLSALTDFAVLALPIPATMSLRLPFRRRLRVWAMLGLGGVATLASIVRMVVVIRLRNVTDETVEFVRFNLLGYVGSVTFYFPSLYPFLSSCFHPSLTIRFALRPPPPPLPPKPKNNRRLTPPNSTAEVSIGLICACLPALSILHTRWQEFRQQTWFSASGGGGDGSGGSGGTPRKPTRLRSLKFLHGSRLHTAPPLSAVIVAPGSSSFATTAVDDTKLGVSCPSPVPRAHVVERTSVV